MNYRRHSRFAGFLAASALLAAALAAPAAHAHRLFDEQWSDRLYGMNGDDLLDGGADLGDQCWGGPGVDILQPSCEGAFP